MPPKIDGLLVALGVSPPLDSHCLRFVFSFEALKNVKQVREQFPVLRAASRNDNKSCCDKLGGQARQKKSIIVAQSFSKLTAPIPGQIRCPIQIDEGSPNLVVPEYQLLPQLGLNCKHLQGSFVQIAPLESLVFAMQTGKETVHRLKKHLF